MNLSELNQSVQFGSIYKELKAIRQIFCNPRKVIHSQEAWNENLRNRNLLIEKYRYPENLQDWELFFKTYDLYDKFHTKYVFLNNCSDRYVAQFNMNVEDINSVKQTSVPIHLLELLLFSVDGTFKRHEN